MNVDLKQSIWVERYRPHTIEDCILPKNLKETFQGFVDQNHIPNMILAGPAGVGKTTVAKALCDQLGCDYIVINGSMNGNIDTLRNEIMTFASTMSFSGGRKYVIIDEFDYVNPNSTQPALRNFMEEFSKNCGFIFTANFKNRIIEPLHSRAPVIDFIIPNGEKSELASQFMKRLVAILKQENVEADPKALAGVITRYFPDWRRILNEVQRYSASGPIDSGILATFKDSQLTPLIGFIKDKNFTNVRKWVGENSDIDQTTIFRALYDTLAGELETASVPQLVLILADYQYKAAFVVDAQINLAACFVEIMAGCEFR